MMGPNPISILSTYLNLRREHWLSPEQIRPMQCRRLKEIASAALLAPYYVRRGDVAAAIDSKDPAPEDFALLPKQDVRAGPSDFINREHAASRLCRMHTSGSTGAPMEVFSDNRALEHRSAIGLLLAQDFRRSPNDLLAEVSRESMDYRPFPLPGLFRKKHISIFQGEREIYDSIRAIRPDIIGYYPSLALQLSRINDSLRNPLRLKSVFCGGEVLSRQARASIAESFSCKVYEQYSSVEFSAMAWECPEEHRLHVNESSFLIEILGANGKAKTHGEGDVAVTCFFNRAMPLLRYLIGDRAKWGQECPCGRGTRVIESICGRSDDLIVLPSGRISNPFEFIMLHTGGDIGGIWEYQIVQERRDLIVFRYVPHGGGITPAGLAELRRRLARACKGESVKIEIEETGKIPRQKSGKYKPIVSKVSAGPELRKRA